MKTLNLVQGTPEWHQHRATHFNASDAPAMLGVSPYKTRAQLVRERATGITPEVDAATERRFADGHRFEALARPLAEEIIGEDLFPCVGEDGALSASFDGLTMLWDTAWEHKTLNNDLRELVWAGDDSHLPEHYRVQMEQQLMVSGAERVLFMASKWEGNTLIEERHCWYAGDPQLRERIIAGWEQFAADVSSYKPEAAAVAASVAKPVEGFGTLSLRVEGRVLASNLDAFRADAEAFIARLPKPADLRDDQDFADAEQAVKACSEAETRIKAAKDAALAQMADVDAVLRTADVIAETVRAARLALDKVVKAEKERRRGEIVEHYVGHVRAHVESINATLGAHAISLPASLRTDIAGAAKGKKTLGSITDACDEAAANAKIAASQQAERIRACIVVLDEHAEHAHLFADRVQLCASKSPDDLRNLITARVAEHERREAARLEADRERIRQEEAARLHREQEEQAVADSSIGIASSGGVSDSGEVPDRVRHMTGSGSHVQGGGTPAADGLRTAAAAPLSKIKLGEINAAIGPLSITAEGLAQLGFNPVAQERAAKLYDASRLTEMLNAMASVLNRAAREQRWAA